MVCTVCCNSVDEISAVVSRTGTSVSLGCVISTSERIRAEMSWYKDDRRIDDDGGQHYAITRNETITLLNITKVCEFSSLSLSLSVSVCLSVSLSMVAFIIKSRSAPTHLRKI